ncbi:hypothetical protein LEP1GSC171_3959 [Leptospira santarosai str. HAI1380]|uniref:Uncharacterized protein n=1 Tax=Leptospira santarosai serovar Shermani str. LT 821 TaxID=758847 RepID=K8XUZ8_9LEPT|nr:hypothetical protein LEP1GSC163_2870 [Leptospira santarosai str. CBC379]EKS09484.1 hypothetical protein LEP1GSC071_3582 [Leptospira santarosai str. JET]EKT85244.1 hypothetical protein LSS_18488 [Leptospira santarosai serovar Shermani str. LT 821]EMM87752.1 hypothetical protein LEP1GSC039_2556 [Leptospira santarosai str. 2000027870]EMO12783.1 hypothetical protein LEP1GSC165_3871 [Leptospira santarosai str. CBC523]EMO31383.1 hypothetical protein LEP1GSC175_2277 [Leptospira santarosai str. HAI
MLILILYLPIFILRRVVESDFSLFLKFFSKEFQEGIQNRFGIRFSFLDRNAF